MRTCSQPGQQGLLVFGSPYHTCLRYVVHRFLSHLSPEEIWINELYRLSTSFETQRPVSIGWEEFPYRGAQVTSVLRGREQGVEYSKNTETRTSQRHSFGIRFSRKRHERLLSRNGTKLQLQVFWSDKCVVNRRGRKKPFNMPLLLCTSKSTF